MPQKSSQSGGSGTSASGSNTVMITATATAAAAILAAIVLAKRNGNNFSPSSSFSSLLRPFASSQGPPVAARKPERVLIGHVEGQNRGENPMKPPKVIEDPYYWLRDDKRENKQVIKYLNEENDYAKKEMKPLQGFIDELNKEFLSHIKETDDSAPYPYGDFLYYSRMEKGKSYRIYCRKPKSSSSSKSLSKTQESGQASGAHEGEQILLDVNKLAEGKAFCDVGAWAVSPDHSFLAYAVDFEGYETYTIHFKDLQSGETLPGKIESTTGRIAWGQTKNTVYYSTFDAAHRPNKVWRKDMRDILAKNEDKQTEGARKDEMLLEEQNELFNLYFYKSRSGRFMFLETSSTETSECYSIDLSKGETAKPTLIAKREKGVLYDADHNGDYFYIVTNRDKAKNFKLVRTKISSPSAVNWSDVIPYDKAMKIDGIDCFRDFIAISGRKDGFTQMWIKKDLDSTDSSISAITFPEPVFEVHASTNKNYETDIYRFSYTSMVTPRSVFDYNVKTGHRDLIKEDPCPNYDRSLYESQRLQTKARDGTIVPMSMVYRKDLRKPGGEPQPVHLYGYGSYGISIDPAFSATRLSLLDRGVVFVIAHIRGGGEMGRSWYEDEGKYLKKMNTFTDFIDCAEHLIKEKITTSDMLTISGRSAGGLLMGAVLNMRPDLFKAAVAGVPFVDVLVTVSDASIPLTTGEWEEWGNPNEEKYFEYIKSYSPMDNVKEQDYPDILVLAGLFDPRVAYWEPAKWVAKLRHMKTDQNKIILKTDMSSGHFSAADRYKYLKELAFEYAFLLDRMGLGPNSPKSSL